MLDVVFHLTSIDLEGLTETTTALVRNRHSPDRGSNPVLKQQSSISHCTWIAGSSMHCRQMSHLIRVRW